MRGRAVRAAAWYEWMPVWILGPVLGIVLVGLAACWWFH